MGPLGKTSLKDSGKDAEGPTLERAAKKGRARKTNPPEPSREGGKKTVKRKKGQDDEPEPVTSEPPLEKKPKGERKKKKRQMEAGKDELILRKKKSKGTPSAALGRAPDVELPPAPEVLLGASPMAVEKKTSLDKQLEAHLLGTEPLTTVIQQSQTTASSTTPQGPDMGGFLAGLRKSIPWAGT